MELPLACQSRLARPRRRDRERQNTPEAYASPDAARFVGRLLRSRADRLHWTGAGTHERSCVTLLLSPIRRTTSKMTIALQVADGAISDGERAGGRSAASNSAIVVGKPTKICPEPHSGPRLGGFLRVSRAIWLARPLRITNGRSSPGYAQYEAPIRTRRSHHSCRHCAHRAPRIHRGDRRLRGHVGRQEPGAGRRRRGRPRWGATLLEAPDGSGIGQAVSPALRRAKMPSGEQQTATAHIYVPPLHLPVRMTGARAASAWTC